MRSLDDFSIFPRLSSPFPPTPQITSLPGVFEVPIPDCGSALRMTLMINFDGKFRRFVTNEEAASWRREFGVDPVDQALRNLKHRFRRQGAFKRVEVDDEREGAVEGSTKDGKGGGRGGRGGGGGGGDGGADDGKARMMEMEKKEEEIDR